MNTRRFPSCIIPPLCALCLAAGAGTASAGDLTSGLIAHYPFNGNANDESGYGNHGIVHGAAPTADRHGVADGAYFLDRALSAWIEVPHNDIQNRPATTGGLTISAWLHPLDLSTGNGFVEKQPSGSCQADNHGGLYDLIVGAKDAPRIYFASQFDDGCGTEGVFTQSAPLKENVWQHLVVTVDATASPSEVANFYVNGELVATEHFDLYPERILMQPSLEPLRIGKRKDSPPGMNVDPAYFWGSVDDIRIYDRPLTASEVRELYGVVSFTAFSARIALKFGPASNDDVFDLRGRFTLADGSDGIDPLRESLSLQVGPLSVVIPPQSFVATHPGRYLFTGVIDDVSYHVVISTQDNRHYQVRANASGAELNGAVMPFPVTIVAGDDQGTSTANAGTAKLSQRTETTAENP